MKKVRKLKLRDKFELWMAFHNLWYGDFVWLGTALLVIGLLFFCAVN